MSIFDELAVGHNIAGPEGGVADVINRIEAGPDVSRLRVYGSVVFPTDARTLQTVGQSLKIKARKYIADITIVVDHRDLSARI